MRAERLAALVVETARDNPERFALADPEVSALEMALSATEEQSDHAVDDPPAFADAVTVAETIDLTQARSVLNAVHIASYRNRDNAVAGWAELVAKHSSLSRLDARLVEADLQERGLYLRLKAGPFDTPEAAQALCVDIRAQGLWCAPTDFTGQPL